MFWIWTTILRYSGSQVLCSSGHWRRGDVLNNNRPSTRRNSERLWERSKQSSCPINFLWRRNLLALSRAKIWHRGASWAFREHNKSFLLLRVVNPLPQPQEHCKKILWFQEGHKKVHGQNLTYSIVQGTQFVLLCLQSSVKMRLVQIVTRLATKWFLIHRGIK